jgi:hypothetical protein
MWLDGVQAQTHLHPDASPAEVRSYQRKRGQWAKGRRGGRPAAMPVGYKLRIRLLLRPYAAAMHREGTSIRGISKTLGVPAMTCFGWLKRDD